MEKRFLISDIIRSVKSNSVLITGPDDIVRDYIGRHDFYRLIDSIISYSYVNDVVDCYTMAPVSKMTLLNKVRDKFGLVYEISHAPIGVNATGSKMNYYSKNFKAKIYGYKPTKGSLENIIDETQIFLST